MTTGRRITFNGALVLQALARGCRYGFEVMELTGLPSGTVYPILRRYEDAELLSSRWESQSAAHEQGRPPRRYYELTDEGRSALEGATERLLAQQRIFAEPAGEEG